MGRMIIAGCLMLGLSLFISVAAGEEDLKPETKAGSQTVETKVEKPRIEVIFVLDTTGSMSGLIQAAKEKIWAIANNMVSAKPAPDIKIGLVAYRDRGDEYITKVTPLNYDIDAVYTELMEFQAGGGGDTPESVNEGLHKAVTEGGWSKDSKVYKVIFLVGDCPPHTDYKQDVQYPEICRLAVTSDIVINTIQCGNHGETTPIWKTIAEKGEGDFFHIAQSGNPVVVATPYDSEIAELSRKLDSTRVYYGKTEIMEEQKKRDVQAEILYDKAPAASIANRAVFNSSKAGMRNFGGVQELISDIVSGKVRLEDIKEDELPENMKNMTEKERVEYIQQQKAVRDKINGQIRELSQKRQQHIKDELKKRNEGADAESFEGSVIKAVRRQSAEKGLEYKESEITY